MKKYALFLLAAASLNAFASCNDDDDRHESNPQWNGVSEMVVKTFNEMYPDAKNIEWEVRNGYAVAEFYTASGAKGDDENTKAWFDNQLGDWAMTESDVTSANIPQAVLAAFEASEYADWRIDDIDMVLRNGMELVYVLEVEQGERDIDLYYSEDGVLVKSIAGSVNNDYSDFIPQQPTGSVTDWIASNYPDARVVDIDVEDGGTEVEILAKCSSTIQVLGFTRRRRCAGTACPQPLPRFFNRRITATTISTTSISIRRNRAASTASTLNRATATSRLTSLPTDRLRRLRPSSARIPTRIQAHPARPA